MWGFERIIMKKIILAFVVCFSFFACKQESNEYYLYHGLEGYNKFRYVNEDFIEGYGVQKIAFFQEADQRQYVLLLDDSVSDETVSNYSLGLHVYVDKKKLPENKSFLVWDIKPEIQKMGGNKYIIGGFKDSIKKMDSLVFFLYGRDKYQGIEGNRIVLKNIKL